MGCFPSNCYRARHRMLSTSHTPARIFAHPKLRPRIHRRCQFVVVLNSWGLARENQRVQLQNTCFGFEERSACSHF